MTDSKNVVVASGHRIDEEGRNRPRFPPESEWRVVLEVDRQLDRWGIGADDTVLCGGASGADLIVADRALQRGAAVRLVLAKSRDEFVASSVAPSGQRWVDRFTDVERRASVEEPSGEPADAYAEANRTMLATAQQLDANQQRALLIWNGEGGDGRGGTAHMAGELASAGFDIYGIDPTPRQSADRQWRPGPKKMLALDGGGIRGVFSLGVLSKIERDLREVSGRSDDVLADYFDYIAGTSTGAIIATALSYGMSVDEVFRQYKDLADKIFKHNLNLLVARHPTKPLRQALDNILDPTASLGSPDLRTLLMLVLHNTVSDSPWPLSNCPSAKYNRPERALKDPSDRNLDLRLNDLVRGSTAAPFFFAPEKIRVGDRDVTFQDGGVTPFNNPAMLLATMATRDEFEVAWPSTADNLLLLSVGTGMAPTQGMNGRTLLRLLKLPNVFLTGASISQDLLARTTGKCIAGAPIDREIGLAESESGAFLYGRFNADFSDAEWLSESLHALGKHDEASRATEITEIGTKALSKMNTPAHLPELYELGQCVGELFDATALTTSFPPV